MEGKELAKFFAKKKNDGQLMQLNQDVQIIGIYGIKESFFASLGLIVWKPV
jgi:hypothetical protein